MTGNQLRALKVDDPKRWRRIVLEAFSEHGPLRAADKLDVSISTLYRWVKVAKCLS